MPLPIESMLQQHIDEKHQTKIKLNDDIATEKLLIDNAEDKQIKKQLDLSWQVKKRTVGQHVAADDTNSNEALLHATELQVTALTTNYTNKQQCANAENNAITVNYLLNVEDTLGIKQHVSSNNENIVANITLNTNVPKCLKENEALSTAITNDTKVCVKSARNMLQQDDAALVRSCAVVIENDKQQCDVDIVVTKFSGTTETTQKFNMLELTAPSKLPPAKYADEVDTKETIDFNSRRRRGRLRSPPPTPPPKPSVRVCESACKNVFSNGITAKVCRTLLCVAAYLKKIANARANTNDPLLYLLSVLLSLIVVNVDRITIVLSEFQCEIDAKDVKNTTNKKNNNCNNNNNNITNQNPIKTVTPMECLPSNAIPKTNAFKNEPQLVQDMLLLSKCPVVKTKNNNKQMCPKNVALTPNAAEVVENPEHRIVSAKETQISTNVAITSDNTSTASSTSSSSQQMLLTVTKKRRKSSTLAGIILSWRCYQMQPLLLFSAFILCTSILLPCGNNLVSAAKPKSATQLQQQKQLQQQQLLEQQQQLEQQKQQQHHHEHQSGHQAHQPVAVGIPGLGIPVASGGPGGDLTPPTYHVVSSRISNEDTEFVFPAEQSDEQLFDEEEENLNIVELEDEDERNKAYNLHNNETTHPNETKAPLFPKDLFTKEQLENGAVICHIVGVIYMFVALAIVCDEFFVPSLDVIIEKLDITDDVAGATFMAAGGSAPELFTSVIGVFISFDDVGIGTIVGSAVFNILFVIGMCALFSKTVLSLTWWPLFRDCSFYSLSLMVLIYFFRDNFIYWWEALILFSIYIAYVAFMKWNVQVERFVKRLITKNKGNAANSSETSMATQPGGSVTSRAASETRSGPPGSSSGAGATGNSSGTAGSTHTGAKFRHGLLQLMIHTIDPLHDDDVPGKVDEKATQLHAIASLKVLLDATKPQRGGATTSAANHVKINLKETTLADRPNGNIDTILDSPSIQSQSGRRQSWIDQRVKIQTRKFSIKTQEIEDEPEPLSMAWPDTARKRLTYILVAPLLIPMWLTLPDTRTPRGKKYYPVTFIGSIVWIAAFSYLMVWWANVAGDTARIPPEVMGLTFLAAGTSIPDLITSVIVARKGFGDMAVSSSVGSNIFDVTVGLPIPWLIYGIIYGAPVEVNSVGMVCSITILFMMLIFVVMSIACFHWRMNKGLGFTMFLLYFVFVAVSLMFEYDTLQCPV
ncbi:sodium/potassium/calcium exchanger Nckx30C isoform X3 [Eurosta solidaginis]|uniref:sodium/potassium/calcium exchanger Nckx30C isoform X3 n=1 Tax=Eurosta solidaginis TaxID=178769 RepID=UPI0035307FF8